MEGESNTVKATKTEEPDKDVKGNSAPSAYCQLSSTENNIPTIEIDLNAEIINENLGKSVKTNSESSANYQLSKTSNNIPNTEIDLSAEISIENLGESVKKNSEPSVNYQLSTPQNIIPTTEIDLTTETTSENLKEDVKGNSEQTANCQFSNSENSMPTTEIDLSAETCSENSHNIIESDQSSSNSLDHISSENHILNGDLVNDLNLLREQNKTLQANILKLEKENARLEADRCPELHALQLETLEKTIIQQKQEIKRLQDITKQQNDIFQKQMSQMKQECDSKIDRLTKQFDYANKEKESMVMKYAVSEKSVIDLKREIHSYENKIKEALKDKESSIAKMKAAIAEKNKINQLLEAKNSEITALERENTKRKDEIHMRDSKVKWAQNRLKVEMDNHVETQGKLEKLQQKFNEAREEAEQYKKQTQALIKSYQEAQEDKANQEQEQKAKLIIDKHDEETAAKLQLELDNYKKRQQALIEENNHLSVKIQSLEKERFECEQNLSKMKQCVDAEKQVVVDLQAQLTELESTSVLLQHEQERLAASQNEVERLRLSNTELQQEMESCRNREAELLEFTQKLTEKNVRLQSEFTAIEARAQQLELEHNSCTRQTSQLTSENSTLKEELEREKKQRQEEKEMLTVHLTEQTQKTEVLAQELADQQGENQLLKKKHLVTLKELTKELQVCRKKLEVYESSPGPHLVDGSRTSSNTSLNTVETIENRTASSHPSPTSAPPIPTEPDRQVLIDKIVKIQRSNARKTEKIEFLEEHVRQLVSELQKKTRIIQNYIIREQSGALSSEMMDHNKAALSKHGGIMASVYNSKAVDDGMTLELSLEINQKLQAVLEDTLLKNITLKENMETLGNEIARLTSCQKPQINS